MLETQGLRYSSASNPDRPMPLHPHPGALEVILYGIEGEGTLAMGDEEKPFKKGDLVFCRGDVPVGPKNTGQGRLMVLVILVLKQLIAKGEFLVKETIPHPVATD